MATFAQVGTLNDLLQPVGGLFCDVRTFRAGPFEPRIITQVVQLGDCSRLFGSKDFPTRDVAWKRSMTGCGTGLSEEEALVPALAEALERYSACHVSEDQIIWATGNDLGPDALDLDSIPACSDRELSNPKCPLTRPDKTRRIRWVQGMSLVTGQPKYIPLIMSHLVDYANPYEKITTPLSTGSAAHVSYEKALECAIMEIIERDALSLVWLQMMSIPRVIVDVVTPHLAPFWREYLSSTPNLEYNFFNATTDLGVPTIYGVQRSRFDRRLSTLVSCSTAAEPSQAVAKVIRDFAASRIFGRRFDVVPRDFNDFSSLHHGAALMARADQASAFHFLTKGTSTVNLSQLPQLNPYGSTSTLEVLLNILRANNLDAYALDLSTDEALRHGMVVVKVIVPGLQPFAYRHAARYLAHPRLYNAPIRMGFRSHPEEDLNPWPQPFS